MKKHAFTLSSFIKAYFVNLLLQFEWLLLACLMLGLHFWKDIPIVLFWAALGFWLLLSLVITWFVTWATNCETMPSPGAKRTSERLRMGTYADAVSKRQFPLYK